MDITLRSGDTRLSGRSSLLFFTLCAAPGLLCAQNMPSTATPQSAVPDWAQPGSPTHKQVPPPADLIIVVEDGDLASATSVPRGPTDAFATLFGRLGPTRGLNYSLATDLYHIVKLEGFPGANVEIHQPAIIDGEDRSFLKWSVEEAGPALLAAGITTSHELSQTLAEMQSAADDPNVLLLAPSMYTVWARKPGGCWT